MSTHLNGKLAKLMSDCSDTIIQIPTSESDISQYTGKRKRPNFSLNIKELEKRNGELMKAQLRGSARCRPMGNNSSRDSTPSTSDSLPIRRVQRQRPALANRPTQRRSSAIQVVDLCREASFSASHRLHSSYLTSSQNKMMYGKCNNPNGHGHNYRVKVFLRGPIDPRTGLVYNLSDLKVEMEKVLALLDHKNLDMDVPYFKTRVSSVENIACFLVEELKKQLGAPGYLHRIELFETDKNSAIAFA